MQDVLSSLREFSFVSALLRLLLAMAAGGFLGFGRAQKKQTAGMRTYMLTSIGACLTVLISMYEYEMLNSGWRYATDVSDLKFDGARFAGQVISGIGFLAAGAIIAVAHRQVLGLTTAIGLFSAACIGIASGAGFYECVIVAVFFIFLTLEVMQPLEVAFKRRIRNITIHVEFEELASMDRITQTIRAQDAQIFEIEMETDKKERDARPSAVLSVKMSKENASHSALLSSVAELDCVSSIQEIIS